MHQLVHLRLRRRNDIRIAVSGIHHRNSGKTIQIFTSIDVGDHRATGFLNHDGYDLLYEPGHDVVSVLPHRIVHKHKSSQSESDLSSKL